MQVHSCYGEELGFNSDEEYMREGADDAAAPPDLADKVFVYVRFFISSNFG